jgi:hypothetical protein
MATIAPLVPTFEGIINDLDTNYKRRAGCRHLIMVLRDGERGKITAEANMTGSAIREVLTSFGIAAERLIRDLFSAEQRVIVILIRREKSGRFLRGAWIAEYS